MPLEEFIAKFSRLKTAKDRRHRSIETNHRAPDKPFLLLSIMGLIAQGQILKNLFEPSLKLVDSGSKIS